MMKDHGSGSTATSISAYYLIITSPSSPFITTDIMDRFECICGNGFRNRGALAKHKQYCEEVLAEIRRTCSVLQSTSTIPPNRHISIDDVDDAGAPDANVYEFVDYDVDDDDNNNHDAHNDEADVDDDDDDDDKEDDGYDYNDEDDEDEDDYDLDDSFFEDYDSDEDNHTASLSIADPYTQYYDAHDDHHWMNFENDGNGYMSCDDSDYSSSSSSDESDVIPEFTPPLFSNRKQHLSAAYKLQVGLNNLLDKHKASIAMYDEIVTLFNAYLSSPDFSSFARLKSRKGFIKESEKLFTIGSMTPVNENVKLTDNTVATVPVFDAKTMILSLLHDPSLMKEENLAEGYDIYTGAEMDGYECNRKYGEIHTGSAWRPAVRRFCGWHGDYMPIALVLFGDKSHTDLHGLLSVEPVTFTLSLFNVSARNRPQFWRPLGYIPNLSAGKGEANRMSGSDKVQNHHNCLARIFKSLIDLVKSGGIRTTVLGREVHIKIWIHYIIGDTEGNNKWLGHYPGNNSGTMRPYRDCECCFCEMSKTNPNCVYTSVQEMKDVYATLRMNKSDGEKAFQQISRYPIKNAFLQPGLPLSDPIYGVFRMTPPELLHTSGAGLILYIFRVMAETVGAGLLRHDIDMQHGRMMGALSRQSERDIPRGATRNGVIDGTKCEASERRGNLFSLACISFTTEGLALKEGLQMSNEKWRSFRFFIRQYLAMEEWFHSINDKDEVRHARSKIASVLKLLQDLFPRGAGTNGWNIPKMHGMTKMQDYMLRFGCAINFFGGPGESSHKQFVKAPGMKTQRRVCEFAVQTAKQFHHTMVTQHAMTTITDNIRSLDMDMPRNETITEGRYVIDLSEESWEEKWSCLHEDLIQFYAQHVRTICRNAQSVDMKIIGYTRATIVDGEGDQTIFYAHPNYRGSSWYDWAFVHFVEKDQEVHYPSKILGFVDAGEGRIDAVVQCSLRPLNWESVEKRMFVPFELGVETESFVTVPLSSFVYPLCVIKDYGGGKNRYLVVLPRRHWSQYFGRDISWES